MTSPSPTILCTAKQTRFHIASPNYRELDIEGLCITVSSSPPTKGKNKSRAQGIDISFRDGPPAESWTAIRAHRTERNGEIDFAQGFG
ncbi:ABC transporter [Ophiocordyceps camponoti-floridani]|uniref:ABC transporter n=1 Tax=Ophiocordyceps camponoti-floridani TaxID=2030778 RepID=A0A8H4Q604_9HYPO|nr:ABC transporter [Ophiocordyceps camponoti-floridani]